MISLVCFFLMIQILSFVSVYTIQSYYLIQCNKQSTFDLSCISQAKHIIENNTWIRICHANEENLILDTTITIQDKEVEFIDQETYIDVISTNHEYRLYYDDKYISDIDIIY